MLSVVAPSRDNGVDIKLWPGHRMRKFTVTSAYKLLAGHYVNGCEQKWTKIWNTDAAER
ncbi:hypothetical protein A2U01_0052132, partial [Trifolium medium]|nr:hypothetical protein [Trifolium medium]